MIYSRKKNSKVFIITCCKDSKYLYGSTLIFNSLRVGFPNSEVTVIDNGSTPDVLDTIQKLTKETGCKFIKNKTPIAHGSLIESKIIEKANDSNNNTSVVFLDPDICLWESCEGFEFAPLMVGRFQPARIALKKHYVMPRIHTSFLWISKPNELMSCITDLKKQHCGFNPFIPFSMKIFGKWIFYDTCAALYSAQPNLMGIFNEHQQLCYDHLYYGSHLEYAIPFLDTSIRKLLMESHQKVQR